MRKSRSSSAFHRCFFVQYVGLTCSSREWLVDYHDELGAVVVELSMVELGFW